MLLLSRIVNSPIFTGVLNTVLVITSLFLICLVLIQKGRGGGLAGAFGGMGGASAFGAKAGDVFTRVTMVVAIIWICVSMILVKLSNRRNDPSSAWGDDATTTTSKSREVRPTPIGGKRVTPSTRPRTSPGATAPARSASSPPVGVPAIPDDDLLTPGTGERPKPTPSAPPGLPDDVFSKPKSSR